MKKTYKKPEVQSSKHVGMTIPLTLDAELTRKMMAVVAKSGQPPAVVCLAALELLLCEVK